MPQPPLPEEHQRLLAKPNPSVIGSVTPDGAPNTVATWYLWDGDQVLLNMDESRLRLRFMRRDPRVALTALGDDEWYRHASLLGEVAEIREDEGLGDIDRLARHYTRRPFRDREHRRVSAWVEVERWHAWT